MLWRISCASLLKIIVDRGVPISVMRNQSRARQQAVRGSSLIANANMAATPLVCKKQFFQNRLPPPGQSLTNAAYAGFTLIEILVSMVLLSIMLLSLDAMNLSSLRLAKLIWHDHLSAIATENQREMRRAGVREGEMLNAS